MRTTALLILLVVLVSTGEALQCNMLDGSAEECDPGHDAVCMHFSYKEEVYKGCGGPEACEEMEKDFTPDEKENGTFVCCPEDLCN
uniref:Plethodontid modulating factor n=1 Tax=Plethodon serratus TaxID=154589 RepID=Q0GAC7_9SALA|nr:plethodontid modulating factor [Plethodon serratus]